LFFYENKVSILLKSEIKKTNNPKYFICKEWFEWLLNTIQTTLLILFIVYAH